MNSKIKLRLAREFRKNPTKSEQIIWNTLRNRNFLQLKFERQYVLKGYVLDFYCPELKLAVEIDGSVHNGKKKEDKNRQSILENSGITFYQVESRNVESNIDNVLVKLAEFVKNCYNPHPQALLPLLQRVFSNRRKLVIKHSNMIGHIFPRPFMGEGPRVRAII